MGLIRFLIIAICSLYIIRSLVRIFLPMLFGSIINKAQEQARQQQQPPKPDGRVRVDYKPDGKSSVPDSEGEFVDYEEIK
ncbi:hypothetical protein ACVW0P_000346 [Mucilaginibacter sp. UYNi724]